MHTVVRPRSSSASAAASSVSSAARVAVAGATGYTGQELLRILARHSALQLTAAMSSGATAARTLPALQRLWKGEITPLSPETLREADVVFLALPDAAAAELAPALVEAGVRVVDLSGAFRLKDPVARARWYPETRRLPGDVVYGLTELERAALTTASLVANPGCYPTAALLALAPLARAGLLLAGSDIIVDAKSGVSGAGKSPSERTHFSECHGSVAAYGVFSHRHGAEIEQGVYAMRAEPHPINFVPHLVPLDRGILSTAYVRVAAGVTEERIADQYQQEYASAPFVRLVGAALPEIKHVAHTNFCDIGWRVDASGRAVLVSVIDNLLKGASGQAVQNLNIMLGLDETTGLW
ncbi:MAG: N-acetyl-gamma-glutamyl-phosphate reductase [Blastocatellia bacterium]|nr:MAG: N-acetyl-gamma-glutamyl-phosphate reductase [Blastocatellia bacterium]